MTEREKILFLSHCLLNQLVRAGGSFTPGATGRLLRLLSGYSVFIYQLPCPEYIFLGERDKKSQDVWESFKGFKEFLSSLASEVKERTYQIIKDRDLVVIGIARSPCCSSSKIYRGCDLVEGKGLWILELEKRFKFDIIEFDFKKVDESLQKIKQFLDKKVIGFESEGKIKAGT